ncbi:MAG: metal-sensitive transcriptional regulator [Gemmatimonadota bacterium]|nr:metal-sensitive transcriptional regulator [Gemmatimonadota bacterium]
MSGEELAACACGVATESGERKAAVVDPEIKTAALHRLRRIEGQVRGLQRMVDEERYCAEVMTQVASVQEALRGVSKALLQNHLRHCAAAAIRSGDPDRAEAMYAELIDLMQRGSR